MLYTLNNEIRKGQIQCLIIGQWKKEVVLLTNSFPGSYFILLASEKNT